MDGEEEQQSSEAEEEVGGKERKLWIAPIIKAELDKVKKRVLTKDRDFVMVLDGEEGCSPKGTKTLMADGSWKNIEDIKIGDVILSPQEDGTNIFSPIIKLFKFKAKNIYDVYELNRQKKKLYSCSNNHSIPVNIRINPRVNGERKKEDSYWTIKTYTAEEFYNHRNGFSSNTTSPTMFMIKEFMNKKNCEIEPYSLGVWLGDGHFSSGVKYKDRESNICIRRECKRRLNNGKVILIREGIVNRPLKKQLKYTHRNVGITTENFEIIEEVSKFYPIMWVYEKKNNKSKTYHFSLNGEFCKVLMKYNLEGKGSGEKFIPKEALTSDAEYRKKLLAGMIDTDGYLSKGGSYSITTKSEQLARDIEFLIFSLGGRAAIRKIKKGIKKIGFVGEYYNVSFYIGNLKLPIKIKRKIRTNNIFYLRANRKSITLKKKKGDIVYGFTVDSPSHLYITDNYMVTKNSGKSVLAMQLASYLDPNFNLDQVVFNSDQFLKLIKDPKTKKGACIVMDEAFSAASSRASLSEVNRAMIGVATEMRQKNLFIILCLPSFFDLDRYFALWRCRALFHVYFTPEEDRRYIIFTKDQKKSLYLLGKKFYNYSKPHSSYPPFTFPNYYALDETEYRLKKADAFKKRTISNQARKWLIQRNAYAKYVIKVMGVAQDEVGRIPAQYGGEPLTQQAMSLIMKELLGDEE